MLVIEGSKYYEYETGFYFNGSKTYRVRWLGYCTVCIFFIFLISVIVIISPLLSGATVYSELKSYAFDTPANPPKQG
jgi:hypothetical protein